jgi:hypothetical protein
VFALAVLLKYRTGTDLFINLPARTAPYSAGGILYGENKN